MFRVPRPALTGIAGTLLTLVGSAAASPVDLTTLSIEELLAVEVTTVSRRAEKFTDAAAAIFVITRDDIRRSGATSIPEALRMAPGLQVARLDANKWAITARGFSGRFANKLLVLIDGRSVYTPLFSGVYWDAQDTLLEDVERIEIIRGPGATLWGANAVNGVINIITRDTADTHGGLVAAGTGSEERGFAGARYGGNLGADGHYRLFAKYFQRDGGSDADGDDTGDDWHSVRGGFRADLAAAAGHRFTLQGEAHRGRAGTTSELPLLQPPYAMIRDADVRTSGGHLLGRWEFDAPGSAGGALQFYYDHTQREETALVREVRDTLDLDLQHGLRPGQRHNLLWGLGLRYTRDRIDREASAQVDDNSHSNRLFSGFVQDEIDLLGDTLRLTLGSKFEHNDHTGFEIQPSARLRWTFHPQHTLWASVSRAVRTPSRGEEDSAIHTVTIPPLSARNPTTLPVAMTMVGDGRIESERLLAYELGYRLQPCPPLFLDATGFLNVYDNVRAVLQGAPQTAVASDGSPYIVLPLYFDNSIEGRSYGAELAAEWTLLDAWRLRASYTYLTLNLSGRGTHGTFEARRIEGASPRHQAQLQSSCDLPGRVELDLWLRFVDELPSLEVDAYLTLDARLGWQLSDNLELALVGQNLLDPRHPESVPEGAVGSVPTEVQRSVYGKVAWRF